MAMPKEMSVCGLAPAPAVWPERRPSLDRPAAACRRWNQRVPAGAMMRGGAPSVEAAGVGVSIPSRFAATSGRSSIPRSIDARLNTSAAVLRPARWAPVGDLRQFRPELAAAARCSSPVRSAIRSAPSKMPRKSKATPLRSRSRIGHASAPLAPRRVRPRSAVGAVRRMATSCAPSGSRRARGISTSSA